MWRRIKGNRISTEFNVHTYGVSYVIASANGNNKRFSFVKFKARFCCVRNLNQNPFNQSVEIGRSANCLNANFSLIKVYTKNIFPRFHTKPRILTPPKTPPVLKSAIN